MKEPWSRPPLARIHIIARAIAHKSCTMNELAQRLEVSTKTVMRDVDFMRDQLGLDIKSSSVGYRLKGHGDLCKACLQPMAPQESFSRRPGC